MKSLRQTGALVVNDITRIHSDAPGFKAFTTLFNAPRVLVAQSCPTLCNPTTVAHQASLSMEFFRQATGVDCHSFLQRNFPTQESNLGLLHGRQILYRLSYREVLMHHTMLKKILICDEGTID